MDEDDYRFVRTVAGRIGRTLPRYVSHHDLVQWGLVGYLEASRRHDPRRSHFKAFAIHRVRGAILDGLRSADTVSRDHRRRFRHAERTIRSLTNELGREPEEDEVAARLGVSLRSWQRLRAKFERMGMFPNREAIPPLEKLPGEFEDGYQATEASERLSFLLRALAKLPPRYQAVIAMYYRSGLTMLEISHHLGVNESRVSQIHKAALGKLRTQLAGVAL